jgi:aminoglycoside phosphotransferase (APT) family kinase protein
MAGWTLFNADARETFRAAVGADDAAWSRGRGWALAFAAAAYPYYKPLGHPLATVAARTMREALSSTSPRGDA